MSTRTGTSARSFLSGFSPAHRSCRQRMKYLRTQLVMSRFRTDAFMLSKSVFLLNSSMMVIDPFLLIVNLRFSVSRMPSMTCAGPCPAFCCCCSFRALTWWQHLKNRRSLSGSLLTVLRVERRMWLTMAAHGSILTGLLSIASTISRHRICRLLPHCVATMVVLSLFMWAIDGKFHLVPRSIRGMMLVLFTSVLLCMLALKLAFRLAALWA